MAGVRVSRTIGTCDDRKKCTFWIEIDNGSDELIGIMIEPSESMTGKRVHTGMATLQTHAVITIGVNKHNYGTISVQ